MRRRGPISETTQVEVAFQDVDMMAVVWHGHYFRYLEAARWRLMDRLGYGFAAMRESGFLWPIIETHIRHIRSAAFGDRLDVTASLVEWQSRLAINYLVTDTKSGARVARARTVQAAVLGKTFELQFTSPPEFVRHIESRIAGIRP
jgi:acyl-CoA thioester hydrolase